MSSMKAIILEEKGKAVVKETHQPPIRPDYVKVRVLAVALNPTDWKHVDFISSPGVKIGCDIAGEVVEIGDKVKASVSKGDHIWGFVHGGNNSNKEDGGFAEYAVVKDGLFAKVPSNLSTEQAATFGVGIITCGQGLYQSLELPWPNQPTKDKKPVLIYGGSTATGVLAIQFAKLSGLEVIATAGKHNFDLVKSYGADAVFDYSEKDVGAQIREYTKDKLYYVFDTIAEKGSPEISAAALSSTAPAGGLHYSSLLPVKEFPRDDVKGRSTMGYTAGGETYEKLGRTNEGKPDHYEFATKFIQVAESLIAEGKIKPAKVTLREGGLEGVIDGMQYMREGKVKGEKLVYKV